MTVMKRLVSIFLVMFTASVVFCGAAGVPSPQHLRKHTVLKTDTVTRTDTVVTQEVIKRHDVITRIEEVVRVDTIVRADGDVFIKKGKPIPQPEITVGEELAILHDTVRVVERDTIYIEAKATFPEREGGKYVWVPDSMAGNMAGMLIPGNAWNVNAPDSEKELVTFRGDTIPMMLRDRNLGRYDRGLFNYLFIPKGIWQIGMTASYGEFSTKDLEMLDLLSDIDLSGRIFSIKPYFSYFIRNNLSVGMRFSYSSGKANVDSFQVDIDEDMNFNLKDIAYKSENYTAALTLNQYYGIARRGRFGIFNEVELAFSSGTSDFRRPYNGEPKLTHTTTTQASLNFSPGVSVFIMEPVSFNVSFGVFGFYLKNDRQKVDGEDLGTRFTSGANFRFNIFNINFGIAVNI